MFRSSAPLLPLCLALIACGSSAPAGDSAKGAPAAAKDSPVAKASDKAAAPSSPTIDHEVTRIDGSKEKLSDYRGKALLVVNTASECGFTPQYGGLQELYGKYKDKGLVVMGFPSNEFGGQEPGTEEEIAKFVDSKFGVEFPMFAKVETNGEGASALYRTLTSETSKEMQGPVKWNFTKFLVDAEGKVVGRFDSGTKPDADELIAAIEKALPAAGAK